MEKNFVRVRSVKDIAVFVSLIVLGCILVALPVGTGIDIADYSTATVAVPEPTGSLEITSNDTYDVTNYAQVIVNVTG